MIDGLMIFCAVMVWLGAVLVTIFSLYTGGGLDK